jgi:hypothetical protein
MPAPAHSHAWTQTVGHSREKSAALHKRIIKLPAKVSMTLAKV